MADERDGTESSMSPWLRDDWDAEPRADASPTVRRRSTAGTEPARGPVIRMALGAATAVVVLSAVVWVSAVGDGDDADERAADVAAEADPLDDLLPPVAGSEAASTSSPRATTEPAPTAAAPTPSDPNSTDPNSTDPPSTDAGRPIAEPLPSGAAETTDAAGLEPEPSRVPADGVALLRLGEPPGWTESSTAVPPELAAIAPTQLIVTTADSLLHLLDLPSGRLRSVDLRSVGVGMSAAVGPERIVLYGHGDPVVLGADTAAVRVAAPDDAVLVDHRRGTDDFIITTPATAGSTDEQRFVLRGDRIEPAPQPIAERSFWDTSFLPDGSLAVTEPGGVYRVSDDGTATRISDGVLVATGDRHYAVEECDEVLTCELIVVDAVTDERRRFPAEVIRDVSPTASNRLSPDGRSLLYIALDTGPAVRRIVDLESRATVTVGPVDQLVWAQVWASDSTGVFTEDRGTLSFVRRVDGRLIDLDVDLDDVVSVATRPAS